MFAQVENTLKSLGATLVPLPGFPNGLPGVSVGGSAPAAGPYAGAANSWLNYTIPGNSNLLNIIMYTETASHFEQWLRSGLADQNRRQQDWPLGLRAGRFIPAVEYVNVRV